jgi:DNA-binding CsgD family transcriptional regulator
MLVPMKPGPALQNLTRAIVELCRSGLQPPELWERVLPRLRRVVPFDAAFWSTVDPATLLFTQPQQQEIPASTIPYFVSNEFIDDDVNKWTTLARDRVGVRTLVEATAGDPDTSPRYRDIFRPLGLGDELRAVFRSGGMCWGYMCVHREVGAPFSREEVLFVQGIASHVGEGIRAGHLIASIETSSPASEPGLVVIEPHGAVLSMTAAGARWLAELGHPDMERTGLPLEFRALAATLQRHDAARADLPGLRVRTRAGRWAVLHASRLPTQGAETIAIIIAEPSPGELAPILMVAYGLTKQEQKVTTLVCRGASTREIAVRLRITANTVQDHLKSIFDKTGVRSRGELVATIFKEQYLPRAKGGRPIRPSGSIVD